MTNEENEQFNAPMSSISSESVASPSRKRLKPGERRIQILRILATMLERPGGERVTTAALAAELEVSEAALYRHFASKAQMLEGLLDFIEHSVMTLVSQALERSAPPGEQAARIVTALLQFGETNPGMTRVMVGDALVHEHERLQTRMNQLFDRIESTLRQTLEGKPMDDGAVASTVDAQVRASVLTAFAMGRLQRFGRSGFRRLPSEHLDAAVATML
jgi:TetR/AcrR family transcriptional regulator